MPFHILESSVKTSGLSVLFRDINPYETGHLDVPDGHSIYYEQVGSKDGIPVLFVHGGPGGGISDKDRRYFDPTVYRVVLFDQRGAGKSTPHASIDNNTTWDLVADIIRLSSHLQIPKWVVFGGSWGSTLALAFAIKHPNLVSGLVLRGIFTLRKSELEWLYQQGAHMLYPDYFQEYAETIPLPERGDLISAYYSRLKGDHGPEELLKAAKAWSKWECATSKLYIDPGLVSKAAQNDWASAFARIECHYFVNQGFFDCDGWIIKNIDKIRHIPAIIVQGRYDVVCPAKTAYDLYTAWPESELWIVQDAGHSATEVGTTHLLVESVKRMATMRLV